MIGRTKGAGVKSVTQEWLNSMRLAHYIAKIVVERYFPEESLAEAGLNNEEDTKAVAALLAEILQKPTASIDELLRISTSEEGESNIEKSIGYPKPAAAYKTQLREDLKYRKRVYDTIQQTLPSIGKTHLLEILHEVVTGLIPKGFLRVYSASTHRGGGED